METNNNTKLSFEQMVKDNAYKQLYESIASTIHMIIMINDITLDIHPLPVINYLHSILSINLITVPQLKKVFEILDLHLHGTPLLIDIIRKEMNI